MAASCRLSIIVVTWNCRALAEKCLRAVHDSRLPAGTEIIVVDNASADGTAAAVAAAFPDVRLIANAANGGFAAANNQAIAVAAGRTLLLLNPDAFPASPDTFANMLAFLDAHEDVAAAGCRLVFPDGRHQVGDAGYRPSPRSVFAHAFGLSHLPWRARGLFLVKPDAAAGPSIDVDWICGACLMVRADTVRAVGPLDTATFMYAEDVEWGCRMRAHGLRVVYLPGPRVIHLQGGTQAGAAPSTRWLDSLARVYCDLNGQRSLLMFRLLIACGFAGRAAAYAVAGLLPGRRHLAARAGAMWLFARRAWALRPAPMAA